MAPEQHEGARVTAASDQYSLCVALYEGLYGAPPFEVERGATTFARLLEAKKAGAPASPPAGSPVPAWVYRALARGLAPAPEDRYPSMDALIAALGDDPDAVSLALSNPASEGLFAVTQPVAHPSLTSPKSQHYAARRRQCLLVVAGRHASPSPDRASAPGTSVPPPASRRTRASTRAALAATRRDSRRGAGDSGGHHAPGDARAARGGGYGSLPHAGEAPCFADEDCGGNGWACGPAGRCVERGDSTMGLRPAEPGSAPYPGCTENSACVAASGGRPSICRRSDGACVALESEDCKVLAEPGESVAADTSGWAGCSR